MKKRGEVSGGELRGSGREGCGMNIRVNNEQRLKYVQFQLTRLHVLSEHIKHIHTYVRMYAHLG